MSAENGRTIENYIVMPMNGTYPLDSWGPVQAGSHDEAGRAYVEAHDDHNVGTSHEISLIVIKEDEILRMFYDVECNTALSITKK